MTGTTFDDAQRGPGGTPATTGYRPPARHRTIVAVEGSLWDGSGTESERLSATVRSNLTGGELDRLKWVRDRMHATNDVASAYIVLAPYVVAWNVMGSRFDEETGELVWAVLPAPAEAGPDIFAQCDDLTVWWLLVNTINTPTTLGEAPGRPSSRSDEPPAGESSATTPGANAEPSPTPNQPSRRGRSNSSPTPAAST